MRIPIILFVAYMTSACTTGGGGGKSSPMSDVSSASLEIIAYGSNPLQFGQLRVPAGQGPFPLAVIVHGGCWQRSIASYTFMNAFSIALGEAGWATWNIEYRGADDVGGGWPNTFLDVAAAVDHTHVLARTHNLDLGRLPLIGHSAGGHLALWAASRERIPAGSMLSVGSPITTVKQVIGLGAIADLQGYRSEGGACAAAIPLLIGETEFTPGRLAETSPLLMIPATAPTYLINAVGDTIVPDVQAQRYLGAAGTKVNRIVVAGNHFSLIAPTGEAWEAIMDALNASSP